MQNQNVISKLATRVIRFAILSGIGLAIDLGFFANLTHYGMRPGYANVISASLAVGFVYFSSAKRVFQYHGRFLIALFLFYAAYQVIAVLAASFAVERLVLMGFQPIMAKILILPITFTANYMSMSLLLKARH